MYSLATSLFRSGKEPHKIPRLLQFIYCPRVYYSSTTVGFNRSYQDSDENSKGQNILPVLWLFLMCFVTSARSDNALPHIPSLTYKMLLMNEKRVDKCFPISSLSFIISTRSWAWRLGSIEWLHFCSWCLDFELEFSTLV